MDFDVEGFRAECYKALIRRIAAEKGMTPEDFEQKLNNITRDLPESTKLCLSINELRIWPELSQERLNHIKKCPFCTLLVQSLQ